MSKAEILEGLAQLGPAERREVLERLCEMEEQDLVHGSAPTEEERTLLDRELQDFHQDPQAGSSWEDVEARLKESSGQ